MSAFDRRSVLAGRPATISDARLIALGAQLEEIRKRLAPVRAEHRRLCLEAHNYAQRQTGFESHAGEPPDMCERYLATRHEKTGERYLAAYGEMGDRNGFDAADRKLQALHRELDPVMREIFSTPANSLAGLRVKTLAAIEANAHLWDDALCDLDYDKRAVRSLIEAACVLTDVPIPSEMADSDAEEECDAEFCPQSAALN
jgi:hypothetical protein